MGTKKENYISVIASQTIAMGASQVKLVLSGTPATGEVRLKSDVLFVSCTGGARDLLLPPEGQANGLTMIIHNTGAENVVVKEDSDTTTICTIAAGGASILSCNGTTWYDVTPNAASVDFGGAGLQADVVAESTGGAGVTVDGLVIKDSTIRPAAGGTAFVDLTQVATGEADIVLKDNLALALEVRESTNSYMSFVTTNDAERLNFGKLVGVSVQTIAMGAVQVALVYGTAGAGEVKLTGQALFVSCTGGARDLLLPAEATSSGVVLDIFNTGAESIIVKEPDDATTVITIPTGKAGRVACDGSAWYGILGA